MVVVLVTATTTATTAQKVNFTGHIVIHKISQHFLCRF